MALKKCDPGANPRRRCGWVLIAAGLSATCLGGGAQAANDQSPVSPAAGEAVSMSAPVQFIEQDRDDAPQLPRLREGTRLTDCLGRFLQEGESLTFVDEDGREIGGLPNLNLERIIRMLKSAEDPESVRWSVSGVVTEFSGRNFLLVTRAVYKTAAPPPSPDVVE